MIGTNSIGEVAIALNSLWQLLISFSIKSCKSERINRCK